MKGVIFTEFIEMVEAQMGFEMANTIIENSNLASGGAYTSVGTYPFEEMTALLTELSKNTNTPIPDLLEHFGEHLFGRFARLYPQLFKEKFSTLDFLEEIENYIHAEVLKLYPDALLPTIQITSKSATELVMTYQSPRKLMNLALGLIRGCASHFGENVEISHMDLNGEGSQVQIRVNKK